MVVSISEEDLAFSEEDHAGLTVKNGSGNAITIIVNGCARHVFKDETGEFPSARSAKVLEVSLNWIESAWQIGERT